MNSFWERLLFISIGGFSVGIIALLIFYDQKKKNKKWTGKMMCDAQRFMKTKKYCFDFNNYVLKDGDTNDVLIDFSIAPKPMTEMLKVMILMER